MQAFIVASSTVAQKYPRAHMCCPHIVFAVPDVKYRFPIDMASLKAEQIRQTHALLTASQSWAIPESAKAPVSQANL